MDLEELLNNIRWMLNLPTLATPEEITAELQKAVALIKAGNTETAAAGFNLVELIQSRNTQIAALTAAEPDPAKYVPIAALQDVQTQYAALSTEVRNKEVDGLVTVALSEAVLLPSLEKWARDLGAKDIDALKAFLETAQPIAALTGTQTGGREPAGGSGAGELSDAELAMCSAMGTLPEDFKKTKAATAALSA